MGETGTLEHLNMENNTSCESQHGIIEKELKEKKSVIQKIRENPISAVATVATILGFLIDYIIKDGVSICMVYICCTILMIRIIVMLILKQKDYFYRRLLWMVFPSLEKKKYDISIFEREHEEKDLKQSVIKKMYRLKKRVLYYEYKSRETLYHAKGFSLIPKTENLGGFKDRFIYSGNSNPTLKKLFPGQEINRLERDHGWDFYQITLKNKPTRGKIVNVGMEMDDINDPEHSAKPFLSTGIYEPTQELTMCVKFDKETIKMVKDVYFLTFNSYIDVNPIDYERLQIDYVNSCVVKRLSYPIYHYKYMIKWRFDDENR